jgi:hypothetical protein
LSVKQLYLIPVTLFKNWPKISLIHQIPAAELSGKQVSLEQALALAARLIVKKDDGFKCVGCGKLFSKTIGARRQYVPLCVLVQCVDSLWQTLLQDHRCAASMFRYVC